LIISDIMLVALRVIVSAATGARTVPSNQIWAAGAMSSSEFTVLHRVGRRCRY
jgi:hypothetical protein